APRVYKQFPSSTVELISPFYRSSSSAGRISGCWSKHAASDVQPLPWPSQALTNIGGNISLYVRPPIKIL
ncbi:hypothetical protein Tco_1060737, partial [Tanacetum coccineum]